MPIEFDKNRVLFRDVVSIDEAEGLLEWLQQRPAAQADLSACIHLHPANLQVLLSAKTRVAAWPQDKDLCAWLQTALNQAGEP